MSLPVPFSRKRAWCRDQAISYLMQQGSENPHVLSLAAGLVDPQTLPCRLVSTLVSEMCRDPEEGTAALQYGSTPGAPRLRSAVRKHLARLEGKSESELRLNVDQIILTTGSQQLLSLLAEILLDPGDIVFVSSPTYFVFLGVLAGVGAEAIPIRSDEQGMVIDDLEGELRKVEAAGQLDRVKLIYLVSDFENPSGICLSADRRRQAVELAQRWSKIHRLMILEDAAYRELRYSGQPIPSLWSFDAAREHVILAQTFSKSFSPGVRVGFGVVPSELVEPLTDRKGNEDFGSAHFNQQLLARALESGRYEDHVATVCQSYTRKRDAMLASAEQHFSNLPGVSWVRPDGGLYVWMTLPESIPTGFDSELFRMVVKDYQVIYVPGELCQAGPLMKRPRNQMRLSFGVLEPGKIEEAMSRLAQAVKSLLSPR